MNKLINIKNIFRGIITSLIGLTICVICSILLYQDKIDFIWEGLSGYSLGTFLLLAPDKFVETLISILNKIIKLKQNEQG